MLGSNASLSPVKYSAQLRTQPFGLRTDPIGAAHSKKSTISMMSNVCNRVSSTSTLPNWTFRKLYLRFLALPQRIVRNICMLRSEVMDLLVDRYKMLKTESRGTDQSSKSSIRSIPSVVTWSRFPAPIQFFATLCTRACTTVLYKICQITLDVIVQYSH